ncbi:RNA binding protein, heterogenous nuclear RNP-K like protein [Coemansia sp. RSA 2049]|nr:RNA binding protein, heterogenous nuclear RNP-K like protein [Coemansia sp. RSA 2049]
MSDIDENADLFVISTLPEEITEEQDDATQIQSANSAKTEASKVLTTASTPKNKNKRGRKSSKGGKAAKAEQETEDINLHVEAGWSEDEKYDKEQHPPKRIAADGASGTPLAVKKTNVHLEDFTVRVVVTRKDVDVIFESEAGKKEDIEQQTSTSITVIAGADDPDIVVDRVLSIKGHIDSVSAAYRTIAEGILKIKQDSAKAKDLKETTESGIAANSDQDKAAEGLDTGLDATADDGENDSNADEDDGEPAVDEEDPSHSEEQPDAGSTSSNAAESAIAKEDADVAVTTGNQKAKVKVDKEAATRRTTLRLLVPRNCIGIIMGQGGKTINNIRHVASVSIHTSEATLPRSSERIVEIVGAPESIGKAIRLIAEAVSRDMTAYNTVDLYVPAANLPSAMTLETQNWKRKDNKRPGHHNDNRGGNKNHSQGNRGTGFRPNSHGGYGGNRQHNNAAVGYKNAGGHNNAAASSGFGGRGGGMAAYGGGRNDRYGRHNDRQGGRGREPSSMSHANRIPVGINGDSIGAVSLGHQHQQQHHHQHQHHQHQQYNNRGGYRAGSQQGGPRQANIQGHRGAGMGFTGGYAMPTAGGYTGYAGQGAAIDNGAGGVHGARYGTSTSVVGPAPVASPYGGGYGVSPAAYQFPAPVSYAYAPAPMQQGIYNNRPTQSVNNGYQSRSFASHGGGRPQQMPQTPMGVGAAPGGQNMGGSLVETADQAIQQMYVSSDKIGAVIGRRGETINEIRRCTNAHVEIQGSTLGAKKRLILITGAYEQVRSAYRMINEKLEALRQQPTRL